MVENSVSEWVSKTNMVSLGNCDTYYLNTIEVGWQPSKITAQSLVTKQKNRSHFYEYSPSKSSESSELLEVV
ncbi:hypothetical protein YC2023_027637 [Brassica napus]